MEERFTKKDYVLFKAKIAGWQENYMDKLCKEYIELLHKDTCPSEKFWELDKRIRMDKKSTGMQIEIRHSNLVLNIMSLLNDGVISTEDLDEFSDELQETINFFLKGNV